MQILETQEAKQEKAFVKIDIAHLIYKKQWKLSWFEIVRFMMYSVQRVLIHRLVNIFLA